MPDFSRLIYGWDQKVPTKKGFHRYINLDNAASTPPFKAVMDVIRDEGAWYSSIHRGAGYKSQYCTEKYEAARCAMMQFCRADSDQVVIFTKNTTEAINKVSHYLSDRSDEMIIFTKIEHHSNELPWKNFRHYCLPLREGEIDLNELERCLNYNKGRIKLLAVSGASNVTGYTPPIHLLAEMAHDAGALILVDGAQLIPHRPIDIYPSGDPRHLDFLVFSGHKIYAPFGSGVLIGPRRFFNHPPPSQVGGGTVKGIGPAGIIWAEPPDVEEAGSPNWFGALTIAKALEVIEAEGWEHLIQHEEKLLNYALDRLLELPGITIYNLKRTNRVGVIAFNLPGLHHGLVARYLAVNAGLGVRSGCFCARSYIQELLQVQPSGLEVHHPENSPGMVRISFGCYNRLDEIDILHNALAELIKEPGNLCPK